MIDIKESKRTEFITINSNDCENNTDISFCDDDLIDSNYHFSNMQDHDQGDLNALSYSSTQSNQQFPNKSLTNSNNIVNQKIFHSNSQEYKRYRFDIDEIDDADNGFNVLNTNEVSTKILALKYNTLSENRQNELEILKKLEFFLLKYKWNTKVLETDNSNCSMSTILVCDNSCESKLNLTNLVVRLKLKLENFFVLYSVQMNEFVNEYLPKFIHLLLSKHKCSLMSNELSFILIRNFFKQLQTKDKNLPENDERIDKENVMNILCNKMDIHLNEAHNCNSLVSLNNLTNNKEMNSHDTIVEHEQPLDKSPRYFDNNHSIDEEMFDVDHPISETFNRTKSFAEETFTGQYYDDESGITQRNLHENESFSSKKKQNLNEFRPNDIHSNTISSQSDSLPTIDNQNELSFNDSSMENGLFEKSKTIPENNNILKAINKRKLQLSCPICSSCVVNMSDHLVKKHSIKDRNERKYLMDLVRKTYLNIGPSSSSLVQKSLNNSNSKPGTTLAPSLQNQKQNPNNHVGQQSSQLANPNKNSNETLHQNLQLSDHVNNQNQLSYKNNSIFASLNSAKQTDNLKSPNNNSANSQNSASNKIQNALSSSRKFIKCPICLDDNKYFVNISDHLIKIHHLVTSEMRKPILKQIKKNSTNHLNKGQMDLVHSSNLNKKLKFDAPNIIANQQQLKYNNLGHKNQSIFQPSSQNQHQQMNQQSSHVHQNEDKIYNREGQIFQEVHELEHDLQSNQKQISNRRTTNSSSNLLVTDEDIADYSDLISLNCEPFLAFSNSNRTASQYENMNFDFESYKLHTPNNIEENDINANNCENNNSISIKDDESLNLELKKRKSKQDELSKLCKKNKNPSKEIHSQSTEIISTYSNEISEPPYEQDEPTDFNIYSPSLTRRNSSQQLEDIGSQNYPINSGISFSNDSNFSQQESPASSTSIPFTSSCQDVKSEMKNSEINAKDGVNSTDCQMDQMLSKITEVEVNMNNTLKDFNAFKNNLMNQFQYFTNQFQSNLEELSSLKKNLLVMNAKDSKAKH